MSKLEVALAAAPILISLGHSKGMAVPCFPQGADIWPVTATIRTGGCKGGPRFLDSEEHPPAAYSSDHRGSTAAPLIIRGKPPGLLKRALYCDESGISGQKHYGFGALIMGEQRRGDFVAAVTAIRAKHSFPAEEVKWNKCSRGNLAFYKDLVDYVFKSSYLAFHCMVVERAWVDVHLYHDGSHELARQKHQTGFLGNKISAISRLHGHRPLWVRVYLDELSSSYAKAGEVIQIVGGHLVNQSIPVPIDTFDVIECDSKRYNGIQICDLLLGAVVDTWNEGSTSAHKAELKRHIASYLSWPDLKSDTRPHERKFNVWWLTDQVKPGDTRPMIPRPVVLKHPLPVPKIYTGLGRRRR